jgi:sec-independent protein translocase protein TatA
MLGMHGQELLIICAVIFLLFGGKKIPELMKGLGKGVRSFRDGISGKDELEDKGNNTPTETK